MNRDTQLRSRLTHRLDELFIHQHVVRRFMLNHPDEFNSLESLRKELENCLLISPDSHENSLQAWAVRTAQVAQCINHFDDLANLRLAATGEREVAYQNFLGDLFGGGNSFELPPVISRSLAEDDDTCIKVFEILLKHAKPVLQIREQLNFFDYYSPFAMTCFAEGENMYLNYIKAKANIDTLMPGFNDENTPFPEALWLFTIGAATDDQLSSLVHTYCYRLHMPSRNIRIVGSNQTVTINGEVIDDCLFFCVPTNQIPDRIDESLNYFRDALYSKLDSYSFWISKERPKFESSRFMTQFSRAPLLVNSRDQVQKNIVGLWVWDKINLYGANISGTYQQDDVYKQVHDEMNSLKTAFNHDIDVYSENTIKTYSIETSSLIGSINSKKTPSPRELDKFITGEDIHLGRRNNH